MKSDILIEFFTVTALEIVHKGIMSRAAYLGHLRYVLNITKYSKQWQLRHTTKSFLVCYKLFLNLLLFLFLLSPHFRVIINFNACSKIIR